MSDHEQQGGPRLRVDRLAAAMDAARARARATAEASVPPEAPGSAPTAAPPADPWTTLSDPVPPAPLPSRVPSAATGGVTEGYPIFAEGPTPAGAAENPPIDDLPDVTGDLPSDRWHHPDAGMTYTAGDPTLPPDPFHRGGPLVLTEQFRAAPAAEHPQPAAFGQGVAAPPPAAASVPPIPAIVAAPRRAADPARAAALLSLAGVATDIGRYRILHDMTFDVPKGAVTMLLGRNGAGKTTTLRSVMGLWRARAGDITFAGDRIDRWPTHRIARAGVGYVPESMCIFGDLTVAENIALGARSGRVPRDRLDWLTGLFPPLATFWRAPAGNLSGGQKQMLALARALVEKRRLYLIDEPTKGLAPVIVDTVVAALRDLKLQGATILMVEQNFAVARALGDACVVMDDGHVTWRGTMDELACDAALQARLLGLNLGDAA